PEREEGRRTWRPARANRSHARTGAFSMRGADDDPTLRAAVPPKHLHQAVRRLDSMAVSVAVRRGTRGHPRARETNGSRPIPRTARVLLTLPNGFPSWTSPVRPRSPALVKAPTSRGLPSRSARSPIGEPASGLVIPQIRRP